MTQTKFGTALIGGRLCKSAATSALALSALAGSVMLSNGEAKAALCYTGPWTPSIDFNYGDCPETGPAGTFDVDWIPPAGGSSTQNVRIDNELTGRLGGREQQLDFDWNPGNADLTSLTFDYTVRKTNPAEKFIGAAFSIPTLADLTAGEILVRNPGPGGTVLGTLSKSSPIISFLSAGNEIRFTTSVGLTGTNFDNFQLVSQTPGPLPILGAGAAFGFSRKLRGRIKAARTA